MSRVLHSADMVSELPTSVYHQFLLSELISKLSIHLLSFPYELASENQPEYEGSSTSDKKHEKASLKK